MIAVEQFSLESLGFGQFDTTEGRLALAIARYHLQHENWQNAQDFAVTLGLKHVGISVGLQRDLEELASLARRSNRKSKTWIRSKSLQQNRMG